MKKSSKIILLFGLIALLTVAIVMTANAVSGAAFTTFNPWVDGDFKDVCKNSAINCNIYGSKPDVWLNGGPSANGLGPDGEYFFAVLVPGGQPDPNDGGEKNLSDDYDAYTNRTFTVTDGEVSFYGGDHDQDSGDFIDAGRKTCHKPRGCEPDGSPPLIRLYPYADTWNPGGVYILAICYIGDGSAYPVEPRDCKYDAFKVKEGPMTYEFMLKGMKFEDIYADGVKDATDPGIEEPIWYIHISGTGFAGEDIDVTVPTGTGGYWEYGKSYTFNKSDPVYAAKLLVCEIQQADWFQSYPTTNDGCYPLEFGPSVIFYRDDLDFGNYQKVEVTGCKDRMNYDSTTTPIEGWMVSLTDGQVDTNGDFIPVDTQPTGSNGCYTWTDLMPGIAYDVHEEEKAGWMALGPIDWVFERAKSGESYSHTFVNQPLEGCTPGFWGGGSDGGQAGGQWLWNEVYDPDWQLAGGQGWNPYVWDTLFNDYFTAVPDLNGLDMHSLVNTGGGALDAQKAARSMTAAYLNASFGIGYPYTTGELVTMWDAAVADGSDAAFLALHTELDAANNAYYRPEPPAHCPISASQN